MTVIAARRSWMASSAAFRIPARMSATIASCSPARHGASGSSIAIGGVIVAPQACSQRRRIRAFGSVPPSS